MTRLALWNALAMAGAIRRAARGFQLDNQDGHKGRTYYFYL